MESIEKIAETQAETINKLMASGSDKDKTISAKDAEIAELKKKLAEKPASTLNVSEAATADKDKETKTVRLTPPARSVFDTVYSRPRLIDVELPASDKKGIKELTDKGYRIAS